MLQTVTGPTTKAVSTADAKQWLRVTSSAEDNMIDSLVQTAVESVEMYLNRRLLTQTVRLTLDGLPAHDRRREPWWDGEREGAISELFGNPAYISLELAPVISISSFKYYDLSDTEATFDASNYLLDASPSPARLVLKQNKIWPSNLRPAKSIAIEFVAGYGTSSAAVPGPIMTAVKQTLGNLYENRGDCGDSGAIPEGAKKLLAAYRVIRA